MSISPSDLSCLHYEAASVLLSTSCGLVCEIVHRFRRRTVTWSACLECTPGVHRVLFTASHEGVRRQIWAWPCHGVEAEWKKW